jgi:hypothetical protein
MPWYKDSYGGPWARAMTVQFERVEPEIRQTAATQSVMFAVAKYELRAIPPGLPFLVSGRNGQIVEPVFAFMVKRYVVRELPGNEPRSGGSEQSSPSKGLVGRPTAPRRSVVIRHERKAI